ncbi:MAG TPA: hypothetical protein VFS40_00155 [Gemmatimonadales bacterium]|nr:hypothetical protein [Gemmatimonadales bacterium]
MRKILAALTLAAVLGACEKKGGDMNADNTMGGGDTTHSAMDTTTSSTMVRDTTVVRTDTNVNRDTVKKTEHAPDSTKK